MGRSSSQNDAWIEAWQEVIREAEVAKWWRRSCVLGGVESSGESERLNLSLLSISLGFFFEVAI